MAYGEEEYADERSPCAVHTYWSDDYMRCQAKRKGLDVRLPTEHEIFIDLDEPVASNPSDYGPKRRFFHKQLDLLQSLELLRVEMFTLLRSKSGNTHIILTVEQTFDGYEFTIEDRILFQALLGSDLKREALSFRGFLGGQDHPTVLFRPRTNPESRDAF